MAFTVVVGGAAVGRAGFAIFTALQRKTPTRESPVNDPMTIPAITPLETVAPSGMGVE